jgi:dTDP-4-dehydrorhamnose 3,5-epimerase
MNITPLPLSGLLLVEAKLFRDARGFFFESYNESDFRAAGLPTRFSQDNVSSSVRGTVRGLHFQNPPHAQGKLVRVLQGTVFDVAVDLRTDSLTYGKWYSEELSSDNARALYIPPGFAHGFCVTSETAVFFYKCTSSYAPASEGGIRWDDPTLNIGWPLPDHQTLVSEKDNRLPLFRDVPSPFMMEKPAK